jgi:hypothetical protein
LAAEICAAVIVVPALDAAVLLLLPDVIGVVAIASFKVNRLSDRL